MTAPTPPSPEPRWAPDPYEVAELRWWDGETWTGHTHTAPVVPDPSREEFRACVVGRRHDQLPSVMQGSATRWVWIPLLALVVALVISVRRDRFELAAASSLGFMLLLLVLNASWRLPLAAHLADRPVYTPTAVPAGESLFTGTLRGDGVTRTTWMTQQPAMWWLCLLRRAAKKDAPAVHVHDARDIWGEGPATFDVVADDGSAVRFDSEVWREQLAMSAPGVTERGALNIGTERALRDGEQVTVLARIGINPDGGLVAMPQDNHNTMFTIGSPDAAAQRARSDVRGVLLSTAGLTAVTTVITALWAAAGNAPAAAPVAVLVLFGVAVAVVTTIWYHNRLAVLAPQLEGAWSTIATFVQRRHDLIDNLTTTARAASEHAQHLHTAVTVAHGPDAAELDAVAATFTADTAQLTRISGRREANPDLASSESYRQLADEVNRCENQIAGARNAYNQAVAAIHRYRRHPLLGILARRVTPRHARYFHRTGAADRELH